VCDLMSSPRDPDVSSLATVATIVIQKELRKGHKDSDDQSSEPYLENDHLWDQARQTYHKFERNIKDLEGELDSFMAAIRPIGSSSGLIRTAMELKRQNLSLLEQCRFVSSRILRRVTTKRQNSIPEQLREKSSRSVDFAKTFKNLSFTIEEFLDGLADIPEFWDKNLTDILQDTCDWLNDRADAIRANQDLNYLASIAYLRYLCQVASEMSGHLERIRKGLACFVKEGVTAIRDAQDRAHSRLQNMSTVATFFSAVTATTLQYTIDQEKFLGTVVLALWVSSLILSIASAINLQLAMHWRAAMYRSPRIALPVWASFCLNHTPIACLVAAVLTFSAGLVAWTFSSSLGTLVSISASTLTAITVAIVMTIVTWEVREQVQDYATARKPRFSDPLPSTRSEKWNTIKHLPRKVMREFFRIIHIFVSLVTPKWCTEPSTGNEELPAPYSSFIRVGTQSVPQGSQHDSAPETVLTLQPMHSLGASDPQHAQQEGPPPMQSPEAPANQDLDSPLVITNQEPPINNPTSPLLEAFKNQATGLTRDPSLRTLIRSSRMTPSGFSLQGMRRRCTLSANANIIGNLHFSPDGNRLAISTRNGKVAIWDLELPDPGQSPTTITAPTGRFAWSREGSRLAIGTNNPKGLLVSDVTNLNSAKHWTMKAASHILGPVAWLDNFDGIIAVAGESIELYKAKGGFAHQFKNLSQSPLDIRDIAVVPSAELSDSQFGTLILVGRLKPSSTDERESARKRPKDAKQENRVVVYNMDKNMGGLKGHSMEASFLADAQHVTVSRDGRFALLSFSDGKPPETWLLKASDNKAMLDLHQVYGSPTTPSTGFDQQSVISARVSGKACFGGEHDEWVLASNGVNEIYVWERDSAESRGSLNITQHFSDYQGDIAAVACAVGKDATSMQIASASSTGNIIIWESVPKQEGPDVADRASTL
ncbi:hypothetical protein FRC01_003478, partial [Tulasnella sp. 417]